MPIKQTIENAGAPVKIWTDDVDRESVDQLRKVSSLPIIHHHIAAMPDVHLGIGATVGSVIPTRSAIIPAAVGVDIGCGMNAVQLSIGAEKLPDNLKRVRSAIENAVPVGFDMHKKDMAKRSTLESLGPGLINILEKHPKIANLRKKSYQTWIRQLGTLGGGNHFIELCLDENSAVWIMLHSGSRGIGNAIGRYFIELAWKDMQGNHGNLPDRNLAYFREGAQYFDDYVDAVEWAQNYAMWNRKEMMRLIIDTLKKVLPSFSLSKQAINCHHNYVAVERHFGEEVFVTRKGAIRAGQGEFGIIPGSMGTRSYIVRGKGNKESFCSCSHGAGRVMSRNQAKKRFTEGDLARMTEGVECRKDSGVIDEIPAAYKDIDSVMENQSDLVEVVHTLRQVVCIKG